MNVKESQPELPPKCETLGVEASVKTEVIQINVDSISDKVFIECCI